MNEDFCSYETAQALKKAGFDWPTLNGYSQKMRIEPDVSFGNIKNVHSKSPKNYNDNRKGIAEGVEFCSMPTLAQAQKWLREKKYLQPEPQYFTINQWLCVIKFLPNGCFKVVNNEQVYFSSYESALSAGIEAALKLIEDGEL